MRRFILNISLTLLLAFVLLELIIRVAGLAAHVPEECNLHGDRMYLPGTEAEFVAGGLGEIRGRYHINAQGWNSLADYERTDSSRLRIAIIGDSFIEAMQGNVSESTGRLLEKLLPGSQVHEYARAGANITDHVMVWEQWVQGRYDHVYVWVTSDDLCGQQPSYMGRGAEYVAPSPLKRLYYRSAFLSYLGLNHHLGMRVDAAVRAFKAGLRGLVEPPDAHVHDGALENECGPSNWNREAIRALDGHVTFLYQDGMLDTTFIGEHGCLEVQHILQPKDFGFDGHWTLQGRRNVARSIRDHLLAP